MNSLQQYEEDFNVSNTHESQLTPKKMDDVTERMVQHLLRRPYDLIDASRLMRRFQASVDDFQQALKRLEQAAQPSA